MWAKFIENGMPLSLEEARDRTANSTEHAGFAFVGKGFNQIQFSISTWNLSEILGGGGRMLAISELFQLNIFSRMRGVGGRWVLKFRITSYRITKI